MKEHLKLVVWPRKSKKGVYRYAIVGMIVTDEPLEGKNEVVIDQGALESLIGETLNRMMLRKPKVFLKDANMVLTSLSEV